TGDGHTFRNNRVASDRYAERTTDRYQRRRGALPAAAREIRVSRAALASLRPRPTPIALTPRPIGGCLLLQKCHTARISGVDDCRRNARALAFLAATVRPHGRGECSCEREPRPSDHPRPGLLFDALTGVRPFDRVSSSRPTPGPDGK